MMDRQVEDYNIVAEKILGREVLIEGRVRKNQQFERTEMIVNSIGQLNISDETEKLIGQLLETAKEISRNMGHFQEDFAC